MAVRHASVLPCLGMGIQTQKNAGDKWPYPRRVNPGGTYFFFAVFFAGFFAAFFVAKTLTSLHTFKVNVNFFRPLYSRCQFLGHDSKRVRADLLKTLIPLQ